MSTQERQPADVDLAAEESRYQSVEGAGRLHIFDRRADEPRECYVEADLEALLPVGDPGDGNETGSRGAE